MGCLRARAIVAVAIVAAAVPAVADPSRTPSTLSTEPPVSIDSSALRSELGLPLVIPAKAAADHRFASIIKTDPSKHIVPGILGPIAFVATGVMFLHGRSRGTKREAITVAPIMKDGVIGVGVGRQF